MSKLRQWSPNCIAICNHSIGKSSASVTLGEKILEIEEIEESKEIATTEQDLRKFHKEKYQTYRIWKPVQVQHRCFQKMHGDEMIL